MDSTTIIGICASVFTGISLLPQLVKLVREKAADDISLVMLISLFTGLCLWIWYGIKQEDPVIIVANAFSLIMNGAILILSLKYKKKSN